MEAGFSPGALALNFVQVGTAQRIMAGVDSGPGRGEEWSLTALSHEIFQLPVGPWPRPACGEAFLGHLTDPGQLLGKHGS